MGNPQRGRNIWKLYNIHGLAQRVDDLEKFWYLQRRIIYRTIVGAKSSMQMSDVGRIQTLCVIHWLYHCPISPFHLQDIFEWTDLTGLWEVNN
jgi:hypothetical protein